MLTTSWPPVRRLVTLVTEQIGPAIAGCSAAELALLALRLGSVRKSSFAAWCRGDSPEWFPPGSLAAASVSFGLVHFASRAYAAVAGIIGLYLGALFLWQGSLLAPIVTHALYDFVALLYVARRSASLRD